MPALHTEHPADSKRLLRNLRRRLRYQYQLDRPKVWPASRPTDLAGIWWRNRLEAEFLLATLQQATDTGSYVSAWCRLNHLREC